MKGREELLEEGAAIRANLLRTNDPEVRKDLHARMNEIDAQLRLAGWFEKKNVHEARPMNKALSKSWKIIAIACAVTLLGGGIWPAAHFLWPEAKPEKIIVSTQKQTTPPPARVRGQVKKLPVQTAFTPLVKMKADLADQLENVTRDAQNQVENTRASYGPGTMLNKALDNLNSVQKEFLQQIELQTRLELADAENRLTRRISLDKSERIEQKLQQRRREAEEQKEAATLKLSAVGELILETLGHGRSLITEQDVTAAQESQRLHLPPIKREKPV